MATQDADALQNPLIDSSLSSLQLNVEPPFSKEEVEKMAKTARSAVIPLNYIITDQKERIQILEQENKKLEEKNNRLQKEISNEDKARTRLSDSNASFTKLSSAFMLWFGNLTSVFWLCKDFSYVSTFDLAFVFLALATSFAFFNTILSIITWFNNKGQMDKIEKDYQAGRSEIYKNS